MCMLRRVDKLQGAMASTPEEPVDGRVNKLAFNEVVAAKVSKLALLHSIFFYSYHQ